MTIEKMTSMQRVLTTLGHSEPDRVPLFFLFTTHGAKELGLSIKEYFSNAASVAEGQLRLLEKYRHDNLYSVFYAPVEIEAWGGEVIYSTDGPPNSGEPFIHNHEQILNLSVPPVEETPCLARVIEATRMMKDEVKDEVPIIGVVMSPFSLPVMQLGFEAYLEIIYREPKLFNRLMDVNKLFCANWANAQLKAGATAIGYFDPVSSPTIVPRDIYLKTGYPVALETLKMIEGPTATHMASGRILPIIDDLASTGTAAVGVSSYENLVDIKDACRGRLTVLGNLNGIEMINWDEEDAAKAVKDAVSKAGPGGGFILSDNHGEIPYQVPEKVLHAVSEAVREFGRYPIE
jgi:uroporphyrinogen decarboxylase